MNQFHEEALVILDSFSDSLFKESLKGLVAYTIERNK